MNKKEEAKIEALLSELWERNLPTLHERLNVLDRAASEAASGSLTEASRTEALDIAHKLSGSLGLFGRHQGTEIVRKIEQILNSPVPSALVRLTPLATELRRVLQIA
jgi:HPt (histidine-containing phosphotransfer) domain-containing protein